MLHSKSVSLRKITDGNYPEAIDGQVLFVREYLQGSYKITERIVKKEDGTEVIIDSSIKLL